MMPRYKIKFKVEQIYDVEIDTPCPQNSKEFKDEISDMIIEDYEVGNMNNEFATETYSTEKVERMQ